MKESKKLFERLATNDKYAGIIWSTVRLKSVDILDMSKSIFKVAYEFNTVENKTGTIVFQNILVELNFKDIEEEINDHDTTSEHKGLAHSFFRTYEIKGSWIALSGNTFTEESNDGCYTINMPE